jgi:lactate dehydrogenase-like 2-hydroxyacid dehydrogenase
MKFERLGFYGFSSDDLRGEAVTALMSELRTRAEVVDVASGAEDLGSVEALIVQLGAPVDAAVFERAPRLRYLGVFGTDRSRVDLEAAAARGIVVTNVPGYSTDSVAEFVVATLLERFRRLEEEKSRARKGDLGDGPGGTTLGSKRIGIIGFGRIGQRLAGILRRGFGSDVAYFSRTRRPELERELGVIAMDLPSLAERSDAVAVHLPLTPETAGIVDRDVLRRTPANALWIQLSPMELIDLDALDERLSRGDFGFVFDHADELDPASLERLVRHPGAMPYPPVACNTDAARAEKLRLFLENMDEFLARTLSA